MTPYEQALVGTVGRTNSPSPGRNWVQGKTQVQGGAAIHCSHVCHFFYLWVFILNNRCCWLLFRCFGHVLPLHSLEYLDYLYSLVVISSPSFFVFSPMRDSGQSGWYVELVHNLIVKKDTIPSHINYHICYDLKVCLHVNGAIYRTTGG